MKIMKSAAGAALLLGSSLCVCAEPLVESRAFYSTNPGEAVGKYASIAIDGEFNDWNESMIIATCGANDMCTAFHGSHENSVMDLYALYAAWDEDNLYIAWQCCNTGDTWAREGDGPLTDYGRIGDVPFILALSIDPSKNGMTGRLDNGNFIWGNNGEMGVQFGVHADYLLFMSGKPGLGEPGVFTGDANGAANYGANCRTFRSLGIAYKMKEGFQPAALWRQRNDAEWSDAETLVSDPSVKDLIYETDSYDNLLSGEPIEGLKPHDTSFDSFYEISIPLSVLGINRTWLEENGIGCRIIGTRGESGIDCCPFDPSMVDNVFEKYAKDTSTSHEKDDIDIITYDMASVGKIRDISNVTPLPTPDPEPDPTPTPDPVPVDGNYVVYLRDAVWAQPYCYIWDSGDADKQYAGAWPGSKMTSVTVDGEPLWVFSFNSDAALVHPMVIFNPGGDNGKTKDLEYTNFAIYDAGGNIVGQLGVDDISESDTADTVRYFNLQGMPVDTPVAGCVYICRRGTKVSKCLVR